MMGARNMEHIRTDPLNEQRGERIDEVGTGRGGILPNFIS